MTTLADKTFIYSAHKLYGPRVNELSLHLRRQLFEVAVVRDAVAALSYPKVEQQPLGWEKLKTVPMTCAGKPNSF